MNTSRRQAGFAAVAVMMTSVVLITLITITASLTLGTRRAGADERLAYRALLAAESGVNTFAARVAILPTGSLATGTGADLAAWLAASPALNTITVNDATVTLTLVPRGGKLWTLQSVSTDAAGNAKRVLTDFNARQNPEIDIKVPAAVVSYAPLTVSGAATVVGTNGWQTTGLVKVGTLADAAATLPASPNSATVALTDTSDLEPGDYVNIKGTTARVTHVGPSSVTVAGLTIAPATVNAAAGDQAYKVDNPTSASTVVNTFNILNVDDATKYLEDDPTTPGTDESEIFTNVAVGGVTYIMKGRVTARNTSFNTINVNWTSYAAAPAAGATPAWQPYWAGSVVGTPPLPEGAALRQNAYGAVSAGVIDTNGGATIIGGEVEQSGWLTALSPYTTADWTSTSNLFHQTFGLTKAELLGGRTPTTLVSGTNTIDGFVYANGANQNVELCGSGVLIVNGDLKSNGTCAAGFKGLVYVMGDYDQQGFANFLGALVVEGKPKISCSGETCTTSISGNNAKTEGKVVYDRDALQDAEMTLAPFTFTRKAGTWRQQ